MTNIHIVLADDDPDDCLIFSQTATEMEAKIKITCLHHCESLLQFLTNSPFPDIIFLDLNMPILNGQGCLMKIKENPEWKHIPIVIYSTASRADIIDECYRLGASSYFVKPNNVEKLKSMISSAIDKFVSI